MQMILRIVSLLQQIVMNFIIDQQNLLVFGINIPTVLEVINLLFKKRLIVNKFSILFFLILGIDEEPGREGGTWLALSKENKKLGILLNLYDIQPDNLSSSSASSSLKKGRGFLVTNLITSDESTQSYLDKLYDNHLNKQSYNSYTLVTVDLKYEIFIHLS